MTDCVNVCGTGGWSGPLPGDPDNNILLSAVPAFGGIDVSWTYPVINPFAVAHVLLHRGISGNFNSSRLLQIVSGNFFYDKLDAGSTYFYWIQIVSVNGTLGDIIGPASATARPLIADLIEQLTGQIDAGLLAQSLKGTIDNISLVSSSLAAEIFDRQTGETSFAQALEDVQVGVAQANTFIATEIASRISANSAIAEQISLVAATLGGSIAAVSTQITAQATATAANAAQITQVATSLGNTINAVSTSMTADVDLVRGTVNSMYTAKVTANGLVGGFGLANNGAAVEAGFDVDTFWIGRTNTNKRKPFVIVENETFIDQAVIRDLTFSKLKDEAGSFVVENGKIKASYLHVTEITGGAFTGYVWPTQGTGGFYLGPQGLLLGNAYSGNYFQVAANGDVRSPGFDVTNGVTTLKAVNVVNTLNIAGNAITAPGFQSFGGGANATMLYTIPGSTAEYYRVFILVSAGIPNVTLMHLIVDGVVQWTELPYGGGLAAKGHEVVLQAGVQHTISISTDGFSSASIYAIATKR